MKLLQRSEFVLGLYIFLGIALIVFILLIAYIKVTVKFYEDELTFFVKYLFVKIYPIELIQKLDKKAKEEEESPKKKKSKKSKVNKKEENSTEKTEKETSEEDSDENEKSQTNEKKKLSEKIDNVTKIIDKIKENFGLIQVGVEFIKNASVSILRGIKFDNVVVDFIVSGEDAYVAAMNYGKLNIFVYNFISFIRSFFTVAIKSVDVVCDFDSKKSKYNGEMTLKIRVGTFILIVINGVMLFIKYKINEKKPKKSLEEK